MKFSRSYDVFTKAIIGLSEANDDQKTNEMRGRHLLLSD